MSKKVESECKAHRRDFLKLVSIACVTAGVVPLPGTVSAGELRNPTAVSAVSAVVTSQYRTQKRHIPRRRYAICGLGTYFGYATSPSQSSIGTMRL
jgi:hypothetical protein